MGRNKDKADAELIKRVVDDYSWAVGHRELFEEDWKRYYRQYRSKLPEFDLTYPFESKLFIPYVYSIIETQLPLLIQQTFASGKFVGVSGRKIQNEIHAPAVREILRYQFERDIKAFELTYLWAKQALIYGTSPCLVDWAYKSRLQRQRIPKVNSEGLQIGLETIKRRKVLANNPIARVIDIFNYFQCPTTAESPAVSDDVLFAGWEFSATYEELFAGMQDGIYDNTVKDLEGITGNDDALEGLSRRLETLGKQGPSDQMNGHDGRNQIPCINYFGQVPEKGELISKLVTIAFPDGLPKAGTSKEGIIIRNEENPFFLDRPPIVLCRVNQNVGELYGTGDVEPIEALQTELSDQRNQRNDMIVRLMNKMFKKRRGAQIEDSELQFRPMGTVEVEDMADLEPLDPNPEIPSTVFTEEEIIKRDIQFTTGISDFIVGQFQNSTGFNDTATGISLIQAAAQNRVVLKGQFLQVAIKELAETVWKLDRQFLPFNTVMKVLDPLSAAQFKYIRATPAMIDGEYDFSISNDAATGNPQIRQQQLIQVVQGLLQMLPSAQQAGQQINLDFGNLFRRILEEFNIENIAEIFPGLLQQQQLINDIPEAFDRAEVTGEELDPETENTVMIEQQADVEVNPGDDDMEHIIVHREAKDTIIAPGAKNRLDTHIQKHVLQLKEKEQTLNSNISSTAQGISQESPPGQEPEASASGQDPTAVGDGSLVNNMSDTLRSVGNG